MTHRLLALMQYGINITHSDGHRWIEIDYTCCTDDADILHKKLDEILILKCMVVTRKVLTELITY